MATVPELTGTVVDKHNGLFVFVAGDARLRIGKLAAAPAASVAGMPRRI